MATLSLAQTLEGRSLLLTGAGGFIGKVLFSLLLERQPGLAPLRVLIRPKPGQSPEQRFFKAVLESPAFEPLRARHGGGFEAWLRSRVAVVPGDVALPDFGLDAAALAGLAGLDAIVNVAGLVALNPALDDSLIVNAHGARHAADLAVKLGAGLVHVSTCYTAGLRSGPVSESEPVLGYRPNAVAGSSSFDAAAELADCDRFVAAAENEAFRRRGAGGAAVRQSKRWLEERLVAEGARRARRFGWPNIYCFTKALGEQLIAGTPGLRYAIARPSIVESSLRYPFPGWNEGMTTSAPVILAMCSGHMLWPAHPKSALDVIPVDLVAAGLVAVIGAVIDGSHAPVYHLGSSDTNPFPVRRCMRLTGEYRRRSFREHAPGQSWIHWIRTRGALLTVPGSVYRAFGVPAFRRAAAGLARLAPGYKAFGRRERELKQIEHIIGTFYPFIHDIDCVFRTDNMRALHERISDPERALYPWDPEKLDWRGYWLDVHIEGLRRWVFPAFAAKAGRDPLNLMIRRLLEAAQRAAYTTLMLSEVRGAKNVPAAAGFIVASNHVSHLDMGLIKHALGPSGRGLVALAARDYFFRSGWRAWFFSNYTNLMPVNRRSGLKDALERASKVLGEGRSLLIFPEGTRSTDGRIAPFKPSVGYLALNNKADVVPAFVAGTYLALPKGAVLPRSRRIEARIGPVLTYEFLSSRTAHLPAAEASRAATALVEAEVRRLEAERA